MRTDGQTDVTKLIIAFGNFANASKHSEYFDTHRMRFLHMGAKNL